MRPRANKRGYLEAKFTRLRVWVVYGEELRQEWLLIRQEDVQITHVLSNASETTDLKTMAWRKTHRYLIERSNEDAKNEFAEICIFGDDHVIMVMRILPNLNIHCVAHAECGDMGF